MRIYRFAGDVEAAHWRRLDELDLTPNERLDALGWEIFLLAGARGDTREDALRLAMEGSYHGTQDTMRTGTDSALGLPPPEGNSHRVAPGIPPRMGDEVDFLPFNDLEGCARIVEANARDLAAVFVEPLQGAGGAIPSEPGFKNPIRQSFVRGEAVRFRHFDAKGQA